MFIDLKDVNTLVGRNVLAIKRKSIRSSVIVAVVGRKLKLCFDEDGEFMETDIEGNDIL